jgi:hypothetical protein
LPWGWMKASSADPGPRDRGRAPTLSTHGTISGFLA